MYAVREPRHNKKLVKWGGFVGCFAVDFSPSVRDQRDFFFSPFLILVFYNRNRKSTSREITNQIVSSAEGGLIIK